MFWSNPKGLTPAKEVVPVQMLLLCKHSHHDERVKVNPFTEHPEIIATQHVHVEKVQHLAANLQRTRSMVEAERMVDLLFCLFLSYNI